MDRIKISDNTTVSVKYNFNSHEAHLNGQALAQFLQDKSVKEEEFKSVKKQYSDAIGLIDKNIKVKANHVKDGYHFIEVAVDVYLDFEENKRYTLNKNTGEEISCDDFTASDFQKKTDHLADLQRRQQLALNLDNPADLNNAVGNYAEGGVETRETPPEGMFYDQFGNLTDIPPAPYDPLGEVIENKIAGVVDPSVETLPPNKPSGLFDKKSKNIEDNLPPG